MTKTIEEMEHEDDRLTFLEVRGATHSDCAHYHDCPCGCGHGWCEEDYDYVPGNESVFDGGVERIENLCATWSRR